AEDGIRDRNVTGVQTCALPIYKKRGLLSLIVLEMGTSSRLCAALKPGEPVVVMGPTGTPTEIPEGQTVVLCGGGLGNAVLFSIRSEERRVGKECRSRGAAGRWR